MPHLWKAERAAMTLPEALARVERRYALIEIHPADPAEPIYQVMQERDDGDWVRYEDYAKVAAEAHRAHRLREALEQTRPYVEAAARGSHMMDGFDIGDDGLPCRKEPWVETQEDRILARLTAVLEDTR